MKFFFESNHKKCTHISLKIFLFLISILKFKANIESGNLRRPKAEIKTLITKSLGKSKTKKVTQMVAIVTLNFGICWFPTHLFALLRHFHPDLIHASNSMYIFKIFANTLTYLTPCFNPCLYGFYNENFRTPLFQFISLQKKSTQNNNKLTKKSLSIQIK